jgi:deoxycytidine triphosphate deaminase
VSGPVYQPGHKTYSFLRVYNLSNTEITLKKDFKIAQIFFEELTEIPEETYDKKKNASFNNESKYLRYGKYEDQYNSLKK